MSGLSTQQTVAYRLHTIYKSYFYTVEAAPLQAESIIADWASKAVLHPTSSSGSGSLGRLKGESDFTYDEMFLSVRDCYEIAILLGASDADAGRSEVKNFLVPFLEEALNKAEQEHEAGSPRQFEVRLHMRSTLAFAEPAVMV